MWLEKSHKQNSQWWSIDSFTRTIAAACQETRNKIRNPFRSNHTVPDSVFMLCLPQWCLRSGWFLREAAPNAAVNYFPWMFFFLFYIYVFNSQQFLYCVMSPFQILAFPPFLPISKMFKQCSFWHIPQQSDFWVLQNLGRKCFHCNVCC